MFTDESEKRNENSAEAPPADVSRLYYVYNTYRIHYADDETTRGDGQTARRFRVFETSGVRAIA